MLNLNKELVFLSKFENGKTQNIECRLGRCLYFIDIEKNAANAHIHFYKKIKKNRNDFSKYDANSKLYSIRIKNDALLDREFFENIAEIAKAQHIADKYSQILS